MKCHMLTPNPAPHLSICRTSSILSRDHPPDKKPKSDKASVLPSQDFDSTGKPFYPPHCSFGFSQIQMSGGWSGWKSMHCVWFTQRTEVLCASHINAELSEWQRLSTVLSPDTELLPRRWLKQCCDSDSPTINYAYVPGPVYWLYGDIIRDIFFFFFFHQLLLSIGEVFCMSFMWCLC